MDPIHMKMPEELARRLERKYAAHVERQNLPGRRAVRAVEGLMRAASRRFFRQVRRRFKPDHTPSTIIIGSLSNWQRNQWARAGYPQTGIQKFAALVHP